LAGVVLDIPERIISAGFLRRVRTKSFRNRNWWHLSQVERAFYKAAIGLAELRGYVANQGLVNALKQLIEILLETPAMQVMSLGFARAEQMIRNLSGKDKAVWVSILLRNLANSDFIFCLGLGCINARNAGVDLT
jgi:hypothetical protein